MKRFLFFTIIFILAFATLLSLSSCDIYDFNNDFQNSNVNTEIDNTDYNSESNDNSINSDINSDKNDNLESDTNDVGGDNLSSDTDGKNDNISSDTDSDVNSDSNNLNSDSGNNDNNNDDENVDTCAPGGHKDSDKNNYCDNCNTYLIVVIDFYSINDLHGKFCDSASQPGVDELGTYFESKKNEDDHIVLLSAGDMWQGSAESVLTYGKIMVEWMNELGFSAMTLGNHEFDWGEEAIRENLKISDFPFLAINIYDRITGKLAEYCTPSIVVERGDIQIGIIGAIGDCYSSISSDMVTGVSFKVGNELTNLVKEESNKLRANGVDLIIYSLHDGNNNSFAHYDTALSNGYVDVVFEGHSHQAYVRNDANGIVHIQGGGENYGLSHVEIEINSLTGEKNITEKNIVTKDQYSNLDDHEPTEKIEEKYADIIDYAYSTLGNVSKKYSSDMIEDYVAELYLEAGTKKWGNSYDIVYGGGFLQTRSPYDLSAGNRTYADILSLFPFNNRIVLCKISGSNLLNKLINTSNSSYHGAVKDGFDTSSVKSNGVYYVIVDTYTALYKYNNLTVVDYYDENTYARDLLAEAIKAGKLSNGSSPTVKPDGSYTITPISTALQLGNNLSAGQETTEYLYYKGKLSGFTNTKYGNCYITDDAGNKIYVYGLNDENGNIYESMDNKPMDGDTVIICSMIKKYKYTSGDTLVELINSVVVAINP